MTSSLPPVYELDEFTLHAASIRLLPEEFCTHNAVVVLGRVDPEGTDEVLIGTSRPRDEGVFAWLENRFARRVREVPLTQYEIERALHVAFGADQGTVADEMVLDLQREPATSDATATDLANDLLVSALRLRATDIHIECYRDDVDLRFRVDGILHQIRTHMTPLNVRSVVSRLKILAGMDIAERRIPQDGRFRMRVKDGEANVDLDFRAACLPGPHGEDIVLRLLGGSAGLLPMSALGMPDPLRNTFLGLLQNPEGMLLVTGPTGSGKTTTLYAGLGQLNDGTRKILTAEDPIEVEMAKINQRQVTSRVGFQELARAFLRNDPDVILIGEIRDEETAIAATRAATTGHLVLSTLHTVDSFGAVARLQGLGLAASQVADALLGVVAQRLVRRLCPTCRRLEQVDTATLALFGSHLGPGRVPVAVGCKACNGMGYSGRIAVYELLQLDDSQREALVRGESLGTLRGRARKAGFQSLLENGIQLVREGVTSLDELARNLPVRTLAAA